MYKLTIKQDGYNRDVKFFFDNGDDAIEIISILERHCDENTAFELTKKVEYLVDEKIEEMECETDGN